MIPRHPRLAVLAVLSSAALAAPAGAPAATLEVSNGSMTYRAAPGETNRVGGYGGAEELRLVGGEYRFRERSETPIVVGAGCRQQRPRVYSCAAEGVNRIVVDLGDGFDGLRLSAGLPAYVRAVGGTERDYLDYSGNRRVSVTLDGQANDGGSRRDSIASDFDELIGAENEDRLIGDASAEFLAGDDGDDVARGGAGNDSLVAYAAAEGEEPVDDGDDYVAGDEGNDTIRAAEIPDVGVGAGALNRSGADRVSCGPGVDIAVRDDRDTGGADCEVLGVLSMDGQLYRGSARPDRIELPFVASSLSRALGLGGNDTLIGADYQGDDLRGGDGNDRIVSRDEDPDSGDNDPYRDTVDCGPGTDVAVVDPLDRVSSSCETVDR